MATLVIPNSFTPGTKAEALKVNGNFDQLVTWSTTLDVDNFATLTGELDFNVGTTKAVEITNTGTQPSIDVLSNGNSTALVITDIGTNSSVTVTKSGQLGNGKAIILITDAVAQINSTAAVLKMALSSSATIPAIDIVHGANTTFQVKSTHLVIPSKTTVEKDAIVSPVEGSIIYDSTSQEFQFKNSTSWTTSFLTGSVQTYAGFIVPGGWLLCDGAAVSRTAYAALLGVLSKSLTGTTSSTVNPTIITAISAGDIANIQVGWFISGPGIPALTTVTAVGATTLTISLAATASATVTLRASPYGIGDGTTTFNVPDMRRRVIMGSGGTGTATVGNLLGNIGGSETHTLSVAELAGHTHTTDTQGSHTHRLANGFTQNFNVTASAYVNITSPGGGATSLNYYAGVIPIIEAAGAHSHNVNSSGGNAAHNNVQSAIVLNYIIKT